MRIAKDDVPVRIDVPGATARQAFDFGDVSGYGKMAGEYFSLGTGTDITELLKGLEGDLCQCPHWGYVIRGKITVTFSDGGHESLSGGDLFYWPPGHTVRADEEADFVLFSPQREHCAVVEHIKAKLGS